MALLRAVFPLVSKVPSCFLKVDILRQLYLHLLLRLRGVRRRFLISGVVYALLCVFNFLYGFVNQFDALNAHITCIKIRLLLKSYVGFSFPL